MRSCLLLRTLITSASVALLACGGEENLVGPTTGALNVSTITAGQPADSDGYELLLDDTPHGTIGLAGSLTLADLRPGSHRVALSAIAANCRVQGDNPRTITVTAGESTTVAFELGCVAPGAPTGTVFVRTTSTYQSTTQTYLITVDQGGGTWSMGSNDGMNIAGLSPGSHSVELSSFGENCAVEGPNPVGVTVESGDTVQVSFVVSCIPSESFGTLTVSVTNTGSSMDQDGYELALRYRKPVPIGANGPVEVTPVLVGDHPVGLQGVAENCVVQGDNPQIVTVAAGQRSSLSFIVSCTTPLPASWSSIPSGTTDLLTGVSGTGNDNVFAIAQGEEPNCTSFCGRASILYFDGAAWTTQLRVPGDPIDIWAASAREAFALMGGPGPSAILHFDGATWSPMIIPNPESDATLWGIWGSSNRDVFAVGSQPLSFGSDSRRPFILHFDGTSWSEMPLAPISGLSLRGVWGSGPQDVYAVGTVHFPDGAYDRGIVLRYDGSGWATVLDEGHLSLVGIGGASSSDVYATGHTGVPTGDDYTESHFTGPGAIRHFDGSRWSPLQSPTSRPLGAVSGNSPNNIYLLSDVAASGSVWHWDGGQWTQLSTGIAALLDVWVSPTGAVFAVGRNGSILRGP